MNEIKLDDQMLESTKLIIEQIESFKTKPVDKELVEEVLKIQNLVNEIKSE
jgi:hypothetical protein